MIDTLTLFLGGALMNSKLGHGHFGQAGQVKLWGSGLLLTAPQSWNPLANLTNASYYMVV